MRSGGASDRAPVDGIIYGDGLIIVMQSSLRGSAQGEATPLSSPLGVSVSCPSGPFCFSSLEMAASQRVSSPRCLASKDLVFVSMFLSAVASVLQSYRPHLLPPLPLDK